MGEPPGCDQFGISAQGSVSVYFVQPGQCAVRWDTFMWLDGSVLNPLDNKFLYL
jgi:hypothetical protein